MFHHARKARIWFSLDPARAAQALGTDRERVVRALDWLGEQRMLEVQMAGVRNRYRRLRTPEDPERLAEELHHYNLQREDAEITRLQQVLDLTGHDGCLTALLAAHFGESLPQPCGHCEWCLSGRSNIPERTSPIIPLDLRDQVAELVRTSAGVLDRPRALTRFLCGVTSPRLARARLGRHPLSGVLVRVPFREVLDWVEQSWPGAPSGQITP